MDCFECSTPALSGAAFCTQCGAALERRHCTSCQLEVPESARFCPFCGESSGEGDRLRERPRERSYAVRDLPHGERRNATVLFSDLAGYTALNQALDPEDVARVMNRLKSSATRVIEAHGGTVNQFVGDEVMALFGVPRGHDEDPLRAVRAALELRERVREIGDQLEPQLGTALRVHIGIQSGLVITQLRDQRDGIYGVTGDTVNTAARLAEAASADQILIGPETQHAVRDFVVTERVGALQLRGRAEPLPAYQVQRAKTGHQGLAADTRLTPFVGRGFELATLERCYDDVSSANGRLIGIEGEPGIGKSRLCEEFAHNLPGEALLLRGTCPSFGTVAPYAPFREVLRAALLPSAEGRSGADPVIARVHRELPDCAPDLPVLLGLLSMHSEAHPIPILDAERSQLAILSALQTLFACLGSKQPLVVLLSDWHWADPPSVQALDHLAEGLAGQRLMLLVNARSHPRRHWAPSAVRVELTPLRADDARPIIHPIVGPDAPETLIQRIVERSGGNPLFIEELSHAVVELAAGSGMDGEKLVDEIVPDNVAAVLRARIDSLPQPCVHTLKVAAVIGETFPLALLHEVCGHDVDVDSHRDALLQAGLLHEDGNGDSVRFKHTLVSDVAYEMLLHERRRELHARVGRAIEASVQDRIEEHFEELAHHFARSDEHDLAVRYLERSGDKAVASGSMQQALAHYVEAVRILAQMPETSEQMRRRVDITMKLSNAAVHRPSKHLRAILATCLELSERLGDARAASYSLYWMAYLENALGMWADARVIFERCEARATERRDDRLLSLVYSNLGQTHYHCGDLPRAIRVLEQGVALRHTIPNIGPTGPRIAFPIGYQAMAHAEMGRFDLAMARLDEADNLAAEGGRVNVEAAVAGTRGIVELLRGDWRACIQTAGTLERKSRRIGSILMRSLSLTLGGYARCAEGRNREGLPMLRRGAEMLERSEIWMMISFAYACLAEALVLAGEVDEAEHFAQRALEHGAHEDRMGEPQAMRVVMLATARRLPEDRTRIDAALEAALEAARRRGAARDSALARLRLAEALADRDPAWSRSTLHECRDAFREYQMPWYQAQSEIVLARLG